jgi:phage-related protein
MDQTQLRNMIDRYFKARYGDSYVFRAPETFDNALERWMLYVAGGSGDLAEQEIVRIEAMCRG